MAKIGRKSLVNMVKSPLLQEQFSERKIVSLKEPLMPKNKYINIYLHQIVAIVFIILQL